MHCDFCKSDKVVQIKEADRWASDPVKYVCRKCGRVTCA